MDDDEWPMPANDVLFRKFAIVLPISTATLYLIDVLRSFHLHLNFFYSDEMIHRLLLHLSLSLFLSLPCCEGAFLRPYFARQRRPEAHFERQREKGKN